MVKINFIHVDTWSRDMLHWSWGPSAQLLAAGADIDVRPDALFSKWEDIETLTRRGAADAERMEGCEFLTSEFKKLLTAENARKKTAAAALRWAVQRLLRGGDLRLVL